MLMGCTVGCGTCGVPWCPFKGIQLADLGVFCIARDPLLKYFGNPKSSLKLSERPTCQDWEAKLIYIQDRMGLSE